MEYSDSGYKPITLLFGKKLPPARRMKAIIHLLLVFFIFNSIISSGQSPNVPLNPDYYYLLDRLEILSGEQSEYFHTAFKPYQRANVGRYVDSIYEDSLALSKVDRFNLDYLAVDNWSYSDLADAESRKPFLKHFFRHKNDLLSVRTDDFEMHLNPVFHFSGGFEQNSDVNTYINTRGVEISGMISSKIGYYTYMSTTQAAFPQYVRTWIDRNKVIPREGFWKVFNKDGVDFFTARGYLSFNVVEPVNIQFGHDKLYLGNGVRSMALSDFSNNYLFFKLDADVWKLKYRFVIAQHYADTRTQLGTGSLFGNYPRKYLAHHHLSFNIGKNLSLGFFEHIVQGDSTTNAFDINYLNPVIFFRALEHQSGSKDNAMVGLDGKWNFLNRFSLYGQFLLDEFLLREVRAGNGWWANKYGAQIGLKYINAFWLSNFDINLEYNIARPFTYAHQSVFTNFANYRMPLAHPTGANFKEFVLVARYQPLKRVNFTGKFVVSDFGEDDINTNWGRDVMKSYISREQDYGNETGQGLATTLNYFNFTTTYHFKHNVFIDLDIIMHNVTSELALIDRNTLAASLHFRWNIPRREFDF